MQRPTNTRDPVIGTNLPDSFYRPTPMTWKHAPAMAGEKCIIDKVMLTGEGAALGLGWAPVGGHAMMGGERLQGGPFF